MTLTQDVMRLRHLIEVLEYEFVLMRRDADARIAHLDEATFAARAVAHADPDGPALRVAHRVRHEIRNHAFEQHGIRERDARGRRDAQRQALRGGGRAELPLDAREQFVHAKVLGNHLRYAAFDAREVQYLIEELIQRFDIANNVLRRFIALRFARVAIGERLREQSDRMKRLAQVMARRREEARLGEARFLDHAFLAGDRFREALLIDARLDDAAEERAVLRGEQMQRKHEDKQHGRQFGPAGRRLREMKRGGGHQQYRHGAQEVEPAEAVRHEGERRERDEQHRVSGGKLDRIVMECEPYGQARRDVQRDVPQRVQVDPTARVAERRPVAPHRPEADRETVRHPVEQDAKRGQPPGVGSSEIHRAEKRDRATVREEGDGVGSIERPGEIVVDLALLLIAMHSVIPFSRCRPG